MDIKYYKRRKKLYENLCIFGGIFAFIGWGFGIHLSIKINTPPLVPIFMIFFSAPGIGIIYYYRYLFSKLNDKFKEEYVTKIAKDIFPIVKVNIHEGVSEKEINEANFLRYTDKYKYEDYFEGEISGIKFKTSDIEIGDKNTLYHIQGRIFIFEFNKNFRDNLITMSFGSPHNKESYSRIKVESNKYNEYFKTYAQNEHEAFYILTPHFIEKILKLETMYPYDISISFLNNKMYLTIKSDKDTFDLEWYEPLDETIYDKYKNELSLIKELIILLKLDVNIFK